MSKFDIRGYRVLSSRTVNIFMAIQIIIFTVMNIMSNNTVGIVIVPLLAYLFGWQQGVMTERIDWDNYTKKKKG